MIRTVDRDSKRAALVEVAAACFAKSGYDGTSMSDVAMAAGISKGSLYDYFADKEDLFYAVFEWFEQQLAQVIAIQTAPEGPIIQQIERSVEAVASSLVQNIALYPVYLEVWAAAARTGTRARFSQAMQALYAGYRQELATRLRAGQEAGEIKLEADTDSLAAALVGAIEGLMLQYWFDQSIDVQQSVRTFLRVLFDGLSTKQAPS
jgi:AcrR family transcriptional regulator